MGWLRGIFKVVRGKCASIYLLVCYLFCEMPLICSELYFKLKNGWLGKNGFGECWINHGEIRLLIPLWGFVVGPLFNFEDCKMLCPSHMYITLGLQTLIFSIFISGNFPHILNIFILQNFALSIPNKVGWNGRFPYCFCSIKWTLFGPFNKVNT